MSRFLPSPAGTKRALTNKVLREIFDHWNEIEEKTGKTRGQLTLTYLFRSEPGNYARLIVFLLPKDVSVETATGEMDEDQIDDVIARVQERLLNVQAREARSDGWPEARASLNWCCTTWRARNPARTGRGNRRGRVTGSKVIAPQGEDTSGREREILAQHLRRCPGDRDKDVQWMRITIVSPASHDPSKEWHGQQVDPEAVAKRQVELEPINPPSRLAPLGMGMPDAESGGYT